MKPVGLDVALQGFAGKVQATKAWIQKETEQKAIRAIRQATAAARSTAAQQVEANPMPFGDCMAPTNAPTRMVNNSGDSSSSSSNASSSTSDDDNTGADNANDENPHVGGDDIEDDY
jgi:hypothetical protein